MAYTKEFIPKKSDNISDWYTAVVMQARLADYGPSRGTMIIRPYGYAIWELIQKALDEKIKAKGVQNAYFPLFIPESFLKREKAHVEGFSPELAVVTIGGGKKLEENLIVRPTSETIMHDAYSRWISSWRDLPLAINQWNNVVRWEMRTYLFLRTTEFLWQEGHTAHATHEEAWEMVVWAINAYEEVYRDYFAMAGYKGIKSDSERFAGAGCTVTFESLMPDGKALQSCTSHDLGQNFAKVFDIKFQDKDSSVKYVWQTSWGFSTRSIGGLVLAHGDDNGLRLPPRLAPYQVVIIPVGAIESVVNECKAISEMLASSGIRVHTDFADGETLGFKINKWELRGVPLRLEVGEREVLHKTFTLTCRDTSQKISVPFTSLAKAVTAELADMQARMLKESEAFLVKNTRVVDSFNKFKEIMAGSRGFIKASWCENPVCEAKIKEETKATTRCRLLDEDEKAGKCVHCGKESRYQWVFGQSY
ncbi:proline--tRNA ligase [candidate division WWE3 bacterium RIFCSPHIGHO2_01_FULL_43_9]|uniref:Proline--tRNA ligase n=1 Tax=candidate division WWE3 bacterium RIFCSPHIGHO2_01_FULL_43_9 TaxID=1802618 RepID=A0A1F4V6N6_UNCKA|nr:MAG: proline--tRNA ligase [candidate division WWE3 bacterium RIFCSPHIGHO2_01_FULL_43_9]